VGQPPQDLGLEASSEVIPPAPVDLKNRPSAIRHAELVRIMEQAEFVRGFVGVITCSPDEWLTHAAMLLAVHPITIVRLTIAPDGSPWDDDPLPPDEFGRSRYATWRGVGFEFPLF
jgi:hypothetical protein